MGNGGNRDRERMGKRDREVDESGIDWENEGREYERGRTDWKYKE